MCIAASASLLVSSMGAAVSKREDCPSGFFGHTYLKRIVTCLYKLSVETRHMQVIMEACKYWIWAEHSCITAEAFVRERTELFVHST